MQNKSYFHRQLASFHDFLDVIPNRTKKIVHCANSGATLYQPEKPYFNMVCLGKALMGPPNEAWRAIRPIFPIKPIFLENPLFCPIFRYFSYFTYITSKKVERY